MDSKGIPVTDIHTDGVIDIYETYNAINDSTWKSLMPTLF